MTIESAAAGVEVLSAVERLGRFIRRKATFEAPFFGIGTELATSPSDIAGIRQFLSSEPVRLVLAAYVLFRVTEPSGTEEDKDRQLFHDALLRCAGTWFLGNARWSVAVETVVAATLQELANQFPMVSSLDDADYDSYLQYIQTPLLNKGGGINSYHRRLFKSLQDLQTLLGHFEFGRTLAEMAPRSTPSILTHLPIDVPIDRSALYISRDLSHLGNESINSNQFFSERPFRTILLGNPGTGKSTLVDHLRRTRFSEESDDALGVAVLNCRDYVSHYWEFSLTEAISLVTKRDLGIDSSPQAIADCLLFGRIVVIFDGLDEIINAGMRMDFVNRVHRFISLYPISSVIVTSREIGYDQAPLPPAKFDTVRLKEYSPAQVEEYVTKWFQAVAKPEHVDTFLGEIHGIEDIARNPLLLSLLCSLYKVDGHIPSNRYEIYNRCADLLFVRWDAHRQVKHPASPNYGVRLMEYIGHMFYKHQGAQNGLDEKQLGHLLAVYLEDAYGPNDPALQAREFLEFCADRAWLLVVLGVHPRYGHRIFGFTHRTFYEYFTARALARSESDPDKLASHVVAQFERDRSSYIPELVIQAADDARERHGSRVLSAVSRRYSSPELLLRLMNAPLPHHKRDEAFRSILAYSADRQPGQGAVAAFASLHHDARSQFIDTLIRTFPEPGVCNFLEGWAIETLAGVLTRTVEDWSSETIQHILEVVAKNLEARTEDFHSLLPPTVSSLAWVLGIGMERPSHEATWQASTLISATLRTDPNLICQRLSFGVPKIAPTLRSGPRIPHHVASGFLRGVFESLTNNIQPKLWSSGQRDIALLLMQLIIDTGTSDYRFTEYGALAGLWHVRHDDSVQFVSPPRPPQSSLVKGTRSARRR